MYEKAERIDADIIECNHCLYWNQNHFQYSNKKFISQKLKKMITELKTQVLKQFFVTLVMLGVFINVNLL